MPLVSPFPEVAGDHAGRDWEWQAREMCSYLLSLSLWFSDFFSLLISGDNWLLTGVSDPSTCPHVDTQRLVFIQLPNDELIQSMGLATQG